MGAAGVNLVVVKKEILGNLQRKIPAIMDYNNHINAGSLLNTPPVFAIYVAMLTLRWIKQEGGLSVMEKRATEKATLLYSTIDTFPLFKTYIAKEDRSQMNAVFFIEDEALQNKFLEECKANGMVGVKGYRTVGGIRVSMYNALELESVIAITDLKLGKSVINKEFLNKMQDEKKIIDISDKNAKSFIITSKIVYLSAISSLTLQKRANNFIVSNSILHV